MAKLTLTRNDLKLLLSNFVPGTDSDISDGALRLDNKDSGWAVELKSLELGDKVHVKLQGMTLSVDSLHIHAAAVDLSVTLSA